MTREESYGYVALIINGSSGDADLESEMATLMLEAFSLWKKKQADYGPSNISALGEKGVFVRVWDKVQRLKRLVYDGNEPSNESILDSWLDLAIYALMAILVRNKKWPEYEDLEIS